MMSTNISRRGFVAGLGAAAVATTSTVTLSRPAEAGHAPAPKPTVVLVHGGFAHASASWNDVVQQLQKRGYPVMAPANPLPGVAPVLCVTLVFVLAHTILYTSIAAFLDRFGMSDSTDLVLLAFGATCLLSIWLMGARIHRRLRTLTIGSILLVAAAAAVLALMADSAALVYVAVMLWGLGRGGAPTLLQTAVGDAGGDSGDAAQAMLVTLWNVAIR
ncbi:MFS transporter [Plantactinospora soyae]|uniref:Pimeloyl-ACP methyl ester carboxylesterase n=1 Tax=Plantactinospora soyae TaxID=1544732 RepID=A0A927R1T9_9ACTN|nr:MFS transporter [Plantactinospora soyae]MBE1491777.1 pimeloyl-ACP methyl ester carboxylesterase [Plantactinospora soyae]